MNTQCDNSFVIELITKHKLLNNYYRKQCNQCNQLSRCNKCIAQNSSIQARIEFIKRFLHDEKNNSSYLKGFVDGLEVLYFLNQLNHDCKLFVKNITSKQVLKLTQKPTLKTKKSKSFEERKRFSNFKFGESGNSISVGKQQKIISKLVKKCIDEGIKRAIQ